MRYPEFRAAGLCVSSGVVEAGCKVAIGNPPQAGRDALDPRRGRRDHRAALLQAQRALRGLLGAALVRGGWEGQVSHLNKPDVHPSCAAR